MKKIVPKIPKSKGLFKHFSWFDMTYLSICAVLAFIIFFSNLGVVKYIILVVFALTVGATEIRNDDVSLANTLFYRIKAATNPQIYVKGDNPVEVLHGRPEDGEPTNPESQPTSAAKVKNAVPICVLHNMEKIENGVIYFADGMKAKLLEIPDVSFVLKAEYSQNGYQKVFARCFNVIAPYKNVTFIKIEREMDFYPFVVDLVKRKDRLFRDNTLSDNQREARVKILYSKIQQFEEMKHCKWISVYHVVVRAMNVAEIDDNIANMISDFENVGVAAQVASSHNIAIALASQYHKHVNIEEVPEDESKLVEYILPNKVEVTPRYVKVDGVNISTYAISSLPMSVGNAWIAELSSLPNVNLTVNVMYTNSRKQIRKIDRVYFETGGEVEQTNRLSESITKTGQQSSMESLVEDMEYAQDKLCEIEILVSFVNTDTATEKAISRHIMDIKMKSNICKYLQLENFKNTLVGSINRPNKRNRHIFTTRLIGMSFPMIFPNILEVEGDLIGENDSAIPVVLDLHCRDGKKRVNSNAAYFGKSGGGKSYALKQLLGLRAASGDICIILDPEGEYLQGARELGGVVIDLADGSFKLNPLHVFNLQEDGLNAVSSHIENVSEFLKTLYPDLRLESKMLIREYLGKMYDEIGITDESDIRALSAEDFPIMSDFFDYISREIKAEKDVYTREELIKARMVIRTLCSGSYGKFWNGVSVLGERNPFIVFDVQKLLATGNLTTVNAQMILLTRFINTRLIENYRGLSGGKVNKKVIVLIDEVHRFLASKMTVTLELVAWLFKQARKYEGSAIVASQSVLDFTANEETLALTKTVLTESQINMQFGCKDTHVSDIVKVFKDANLTEEEISALKDADRGEVLAMVSEANRMKFKIIGNEYEHTYCARNIDQ